MTVFWDCTFCSLANPKQEIKHVQFGREGMSDRLKYDLKNHSASVSSNPEENLPLSLSASESSPVQQHCLKCLFCFGEGMRLRQKFINSAQGD